MTTPQLIDSLDSYYRYVKSRILAANSSRVFGGVVQARDWPMSSALLNAFYLAISGDVPTRMLHQSFSSILLSTRAQWVWMVEGDNISKTAQSSNRGDKYRINFQMKQELLNGVFPGFCEKQQWHVEPDQNNQPVDIAISYQTPEFVWWNPPTFRDQVDRTSGILYGAGSVEITSFTPTIIS